MAIGARRVKLTAMTVTSSISARIGRITLQRPERLNAIDSQLAKDLKKVARDFENDPSIKVVVLTGTGSAFSVGGDLSDMLAHKDDISEHVLQMAQDFHEALLALHRMPAPLLVGVNGTAAGGGFSLACNGDLIVAKRSARFVSAYTRSGLTPDGGGTWFLPRMVGRQRAFELLATNRTISADEALEMGLISQAIDDADFEAALERIAVSLADLPSDAGRELKRLLRRDELHSLEAHLRAEAESIATAVSRPETVARLEAFLRKA